MANKLERNESRKLLANFFNALATAIVAVGGFTQITAMASSGSTSNVSVALVTICAFVGLGLHLAAQAALRGLEE